MERRRFGGPSTTSAEPACRRRTHESRLPAAANQLRYLSRVVFVDDVLVACGAVVGERPDVPLPLGAGEIATG